VAAPARRQLRGPDARGSVALARAKGPAAPGPTKGGRVAAAKAPAKRRGPKGAGPGRALPSVDGDAPLQELTRDELSVFLYAALLPEENLQIVKELGLSIPGFRTEGLSEAERCDLIADEVRAAPEERRRVIEALRKGFGLPPLVASALDEPSARDLIDVGTTEHGTVLALWRLLADPSTRIRALAKPILTQMLAEYYGPPIEGASAPGSEEPAAGHPQPEGRVVALEQRLERAHEEVERARIRGDERVEKVQLQLKEARAAEARAAAEAARAREAADETGRALRRSEEALAAARSTDTAMEAQRARAAARELEGQLSACERRAERAEARALELEATLERASRAEPGEASPHPPAAPVVGPEEPEEAPASWLLPVYTREFYDSLAGWDRRLQRAAFKQAHLLAQDHRHPSLRALPLEGLPGYYRVRVATDVRLIYRRGEDQNTVEILSLIDREDLDRYVRQAKTRGG